MTFPACASSTRQYECHRPRRPSRPARSPAPSPHRPTPTHPVSASHPAWLETQPGWHGHLGRDPRAPSPCHFGPGWHLQAKLVGALAIHNRPQTPPSANAPTPSIRITPAKHFHQPPFGPPPHTPANAATHWPSVPPSPHTETHHTHTNTTSTN
ncbi:MAG: hypothetical protein DRP52_03085 [Planctomycetota bacterium]|nr:MAG: hypothetical protein DRP52_03085 [Planctomycetota bacterium]